MIPRVATIAVIEVELLPARRWGERHGAVLEWVSSRLELRVILTQPATQDKYFLVGDVSGYKALPPAWEFCDAEWKDRGLKHLYPAPGSLPGNSSIFHTKPVICAPFNRLAYKDHGGPHEDWGGAAQWLNARGAFVQAHTIADMIAIVARDLACSTGRM